MTQEIGKVKVKATVIPSANAATGSVKVGTNQLNAQRVQSIQYSAGAGAQAANNAFEKANIAYDIAVASFAQANTARITGNAAYATANASYATGNSAYDMANLAFVTGNAAFAHSNTVYIFSSASYAHANASYNTANIVFNSSNAVYNVANAAYAQANAAFEAANNVTPQIQPSFDQANAAYSTANAAYVTANAGYSAANTGYITANAAYATANAGYETANTKVSKSGDTMTGDLKFGGGGGILNLPTNQIAITANVDNDASGFIAQATGVSTVYANTDDFQIRQYKLQHLQLIQLMQSQIRYQLYRQLQMPHITQQIQVTYKRMRLMPRLMLRSQVQIIK